MEISRFKTLDTKYRRCVVNGIHDKGLSMQLQILTDISLSLAMIADALVQTEHKDDDRV